MTLVKFNQRPFDRSFNNLFEDFFSDFPVLSKNDAQQAGKGFAPVNIKENEKEYSLEIVAPGFDKADFNVSVDGDILTVSAEKKNEVKDEKGRQIRREYSYRSFKRSFTLDEKANAEGIDAKYVNGVLTLNLPKKEVVKPSVQQISIN